MVAAPAVGQSLPTVPTPSLPAVPTVVPNLPKPPALPAPSLPSAPSVPSLPRVPSSQSVPAVPAIGAPGGSSESVIPTGGSGGGGGSRGTAGGRAAGGGSRGGGSAPAASGRAGGGNGAASGRQGGSGSGSGSAAARSAEGPADPSERRAEARRDRRLRASVQPLAGCIGGLPRAERRVLTLRAGLGRERPHTRRRVAQILRVSTRRVSRLERRGVRRLRGLERAGHCKGDGGIAAGDIGGGTIPAEQAATLGALVATGLGAGSLAVVAARELKGSSGSQPDRIEVKSERESSGVVTPKRAPLAAGAEPLRPRPPAAIVERGGADLTLPLLILVAVAALVFAARAVRRSGAA
ncbi:MAG: hypothetical protein QOC68_575 [Solirubrobacteraceae bacterium]|nr:hypothetical protein [Solirubrobacteraceae bacterium]